ncbi:MAG: DUF58 domain-containing protein [Actinomycetia bacterium]|nr:DUF58 domain-containing protein [Actinomycetes bacterium]
MPLTNSGWFCCMVAVVAYVAGWQLGWIELMVLSAGCIVALLSAVPFVIGRTRLDIDRTLDPDRVVVGEPARAVLRLTNAGRSPSPPRLVEDKVGRLAVCIDVPALVSGQTTEALYRLPSERRGRYQVGPAVLVKSDPLGLMRRESVHTKTDTLWVHPLRTALQPLPVGFAKDLEGPTSDASPAGDVAFHALREYQAGDNFRHIHWLSTARAGEVMVRQYVDNRKPEMAVLLDDRASSYEGDAFEVAVQIAASIVVSSKLQQQPVSLWFGARSLSGRARPTSMEEVLDALSVVEPVGSRDLASAVRSVLRVERGVSALVPITGSIDTDDLHAAIQPSRRSARVLATRVWPEEAQRGALPGATLFDVAELGQFRFAWNRLTG